MLPSITIKNDTGGPIAITHAVDPHSRKDAIPVNPKDNLLLAGESIVLFQHVGVTWLIHHPASVAAHITSEVKSVSRETVTTTRRVEQGFDFKAALKQRAIDDAEVKKREEAPST